MEFNLNLTLSRITRAKLLEHNSQETYLEYYLEVPVKKGVFRSPLRNDKYPTCSFYKGKSGDILFHDFATGEFLDFIKVVIRKYGLEYRQALNKIATDFKIIENNNNKNYVPIVRQAPIFEDREMCKIRVEIQEFTKEELLWWNKFGISRETLKKFNVFSAKTVFLNDTIFSTYNPRSFSFGYYNGKNKEGVELWKIYYPQRSKMRFLTNCSKEKLQCSKFLPSSGEYIVITKSAKDCLLLYEFGIPAIAPQSENSFLSEVQYKKLQARFKYILVFYDNDLPGISNMNRFRRIFQKLDINLNCIWIPKHLGSKDISDFYKKNGVDKTRELINQTKEWIKEKWEPVIELEAINMN